MNQRIIKGSLSAIGMMILILDTKTALAGAVQGMELCIRTLIPSLLPFFLLSVLLTDALAGVRWKWLEPIGKILKIPKGCESLLLIGFLGGYPVGAQCVAQAWTAGTINTSCSRRMLGFCSNAGPAFIFGLVAFQFSDRLAAWILWAIHVLSALITGFLLPGKKEDIIQLKSKNAISLNEALYRSLRIMGSVCGWVILFRVILAFTEHWFLWAVNTEINVAVQMFTELACGCISLSEIDSEALRLLLCSCGLSFGGLCVLIQTASVTGTLGLGAYLPGKLMQTLISAILCCLYLAVRNRISSAIYAAIGGALLLSCCVYFIKRKNKYGNLKKAVV